MKQISQKDYEILLEAKKQCTELIDYCERSLKALEHFLEEIKCKKLKENEKI